MSRDNRQDVDLERGLSPRPVELNSDGSPSIRYLFNNPVDFLDMLDTIPIGVAVLNLDRKILIINRALETLTGIEKNKACGVACAHALRHNICIRDCPALNVAETSNPVSIDGNLINRNRQLVPVRLNLAPLKNPDGNIIGFIETVEDIRVTGATNDKAGPAFNFSSIIGRSTEMKKIFRILPTLAESDASVLITGETGTGKDLMAEAIHNASNRNKGPFVKINCGALPETLLESELFGHQKGAFTGAVENKPGRFRMAHNGTLFLTEIGDLPLALQAKLLTFLDDREVFPLGSTKGFLADVRVIAATNRNLERQVMKQQFRKDLLFRLNVLRIHLPPLQDRKGDIRLLLDHFLHTISNQLGKKISGISREALEILLAYHYPGNVRELRNIVEYALNICREEKIHPEQLPTYLTESGMEHGTPDVQESGEDNATGAVSAHHVANLDWPGIERRLIVDALLKAGGRKNKAALSLGWARSTLWRKMKQYKIQ